MRLFATSNVLADWWLAGNFLKNYGRFFCDSLCDFSTWNLRFYSIKVKFWPHCLSDVAEREEEEEEEEPQREDKLESAFEASAPELRKEGKRKGGKKSQEINPANAGTVSGSKKKDFLQV